MIANEFGEAAATPIHSSALFAAGLVLFVLTLIVNIVARRFIARGQRGQRGTGGTGVTVGDRRPAGDDGMSLTAFARHQPRRAGARTGSCAACCGRARSSR